MKEKSIFMYQRHVHELHPLKKNNIIHVFAVQIYVLCKRLHVHTYFCCYEYDNVH